MPRFRHPDGHWLHFVERGSGPPLVLIHGLLWSARMFVRLRRLLPKQRVILLDLRGHGQSERISDPDAYTWESLASDVVALLDELGIERAVVGGLSLGANVTIATALEYPERCAGLIVEMPVLWRARTLASWIFTSLAAALATGRGAVGAVSRTARLLPVSGRLTPSAAALRDVVAVHPDSAIAIMRGLVASGLPDGLRETLRQLEMPALVIGHRHDLLHVLADARELAELMPRAQLVEASSILEYRLRPERLAAHVRPFLEDVWKKESAYSAEGGM